MTLNLKTEIEKINQGCGKEVIDKIHCGDKTGIYSQLWLCPSCKSKKQGLIQGAKMMKDEIIEEVNKIIEKITSWTCKCGCITFDDKKCRMCGSDPAYGEIDYKELKQQLTEEGKK